MPIIVIRVHMLSHMSCARAPPRALRTAVAGCQSSNPLRTQQKGRVSLYIPGSARAHAQPCTPLAARGTHQNIPIYTALYTEFYFIAPLPLAGRCVASFRGQKQVTSDLATAGITGLHIAHVPSQGRRSRALRRQDTGLLGRLDGRLLLLDASGLERLLLLEALARE